MLNAGDIAPDFELPDSLMDPVRLSDYRDRQHVVLYFFNNDRTPGGLTEALEFSDHVDALARLDTVVLGVSLDDCMAHESFISEEGIEFDLLSDPDGEVCRRYHALSEWRVGDVVRYRIERSTFVIDKAGLIRHAFYQVIPKGHAADIFTLVQSLG